MHTTAVRARGLTKTFGDVIALDGVDLDIPAGQIHGLIGPNGAGKTTLLGLLLGLASAGGGTLEILGMPSGRGLAATEGVAGFVDGPALYPTLTARQNLAALASLRGEASGSPTGVDDLLDRVGLREVAGDVVRGFSLGMRRRLGLAAALLGEPRLLVLDEPANGLDPAGKRQVHQVLTDLADAGTTVVLSSHRMDDLAALCEEVTLLSTGRVVFSGPLRKLAAESGELDYRLVTSDAGAARRVAAGTPSLTLVAGRRSPVEADDDPLVVRGPVPAVDDLVVRLVGAGIAVRELGPVVPSLEAAFLALTGPDESAAEDEEDAR
ncbi:ABC transporter ATP-binding protein [Nocardioides sp. MAHUQ-72]|uniref:ABC transporter ATP-binding protein n=1 Tax=unclassified Nocardioides TaxID=2615069 RepID=UPI0036073F56